MKQWFALAFTLLALSAQADTVRLAIGEWAPHTSKDDPNGKLSEVLVTEAFKLEGMDVEFHYFPWKRSYQAVLNGEYDGTFPWLATEKHSTEMLPHNEPLVQQTEVFFHRKDRNFDWESMDDLKQYRVGGSNGYAHVEMLTNAGVEVDVGTNDTVNYRKLLDDRIDVFPADLLVGNHLLQTDFSDEDTAKLTYHSKPLSEGDMFILFSRQTANGQALADTFDRGLKALKDNGRYDEIIQEFLNR